MEVDAESFARVIIDRMVAFERGYSWIEKDLAGKIRNRIIGAMFRQKSVIEIIENELVESAI